MKSNLKLCPPPTSFRPANNVQAAYITSSPPYARRRVYTGRRLQGVKYEKKVHEYLLAIDEEYIPGPWIKFFAEGKWRYCQPDGFRISLSEGRITLVEIKYQHTSDAWWQLKYLYEPVLRKLFPEDLWEFDFVEIVKWFDPLTRFPCETHLVADPFRKSEDFKVHIWKP